MGNWGRSSGYKFLYIIERCESGGIGDALQIISFGVLGRLVGENDSVVILAVR